MSEAANVDMLLKALRQVGVDVPDSPPTTLASSVRSYWYISCGLFDTMVDKREAPTQEDALNVAVGSLQPWYVRPESSDSIKIAPHVEEANRNQYLEWLKRGVR